MPYIYSREYRSAVKKNELMPSAATWMQLEMIRLGEVSQKEKDKHHTTSLTHGVKNSAQMNPSMKQSLAWRTDSGCQEGRGQMRDGWEFGIGRCKMDK